MQRTIVNFHKDELGDWVADLDCGHTRHVRHNPPWTLRPWVITEEGRAQFLGQSMNCVKCDDALDDPSVPPLPNPPIKSAASQ